MNKQNINPQDSNVNKKTDDSSAPHKKNGLDEWNDRLDENLEPEDHGSELADNNAKHYSENNGSGDQSDENKKNPR